MITEISPLENRQNTILYWQLAETAFKAVIDFIKHSDSLVSDKEAWFLAYKDCFPICSGFIRQMEEALALASLLTSFPQFDQTTPRYCVDGHTFFMELYPTYYNENKALWVKRANYTLAETGISYHLEGRAWKIENRIYVEARLEGKTVYTHDYLKYSDDNPLLNRFTGSDKLIASAFNAAENALFNKLGILPF